MGFRPSGSKGSLILGRWAQKPYYIRSWATTGFRGQGLGLGCLV